MLIYHLTSRAAWDRAREAGFYTHASLEESGYIHCSSAEQLLPVANAFFTQAEDPIALHIETDRLEAPLRWESPDPDDPFASGRFPHVYGRLNLHAVTTVTGLVRAPDGRFTGF